MNEKFPTYAGSPMGLQWRDLKSVDFLFIKLIQIEGGLNQIKLFWQIGEYSIYTGGYLNVIFKAPHTIGV